MGNGKIKKRVTWAGMLALLGFSIAAASSATAAQTPLPGLGEKLDPGQARIWYLHHAGWAVKTSSHLLIFDYWPEKSPDGKPALENGFIYPAEIGDQNVVVFVSHAHEDHFDPVILKWQESIPNIKYIFGWRAELGDKYTYLDGDHAGISLDGIEIVTIHHNFDGIREAAFLIKSDGLVIYHSGDHACSAEKLNPVFEKNIDFLSKQAPFMDIAFISIFCRRDGSWLNSGDRYTIEKLRPRVLLPMHSGGYEKEYRQFAAAAGKLSTQTLVLAASRRGESFFYRRR